MVVITPTIKGKYDESKPTYKRITKVYPVARHYEEKDEPEYIKYTCPVCDMLGNKHQVHYKDFQCFSCNVNFIWEDDKN